MRESDFDLRFGAAMARSDRRAAAQVLDDFARSRFSAEEVEKLQILAKHQLVEEARLTWNETVAQELAERLGIPGNRPA